jgi:hypothetical protein
MVDARFVVVEADAQRSSNELEGVGRGGARFPEPVIIGAVEEVGRAELSSRSWSWRLSFLRC